MGSGLQAFDGLGFSMRNLVPRIPTTPISLTKGTFLKSY